MGSPITFGGFNNIDFGSVLNALMQQARAPIVAIEAQRTTLQSQNSAFSTLATKLAALQSAASGLAETDHGSRVSATSSDEAAVGISTGSASATGRYEVVVSDLARAQVTTSETTYDSLDAVVATSGVISLARLGDPPIDIPMNGGMSLQQLADAINRAEGSPVNASVVQVVPGEYRLVLTGRATGTANAFTVTASTPLAGGVGLTFTDTDGNGVTGDSAADSVQAASNAQFTVNQVPVTSSSNTVSDVVPGVTLTLRRKGVDPVVVDVARDDAALVTQVKTFTTAVNDLVTFFTDQATAAKSGKAAIASDPLVRGLRESMRSVLMSPREGTGTYARLAEVGVTFDTSGKLSVNETKLAAALAKSPTGVADLFTDRFTAVDELVSEYTDAGGLVADVRKRIDTQVARLGARIDALEEQLVLRRAALQREFIAADRAMSQLNSQGSSLSQLGGQYRLF